MRVSTNYIFENSRRVMQQSLNNLLRTQEIMASQKKVNRLSDDPVATGRILETDTMIAQQEQFVRNLQSSQSVANLYDSSMSTIVNLISRTKELVLGQANSAASTNETREAARIEIVSLASQLTAVGNLQYADRFLYGGYADDTQPFLDMFATVTPDPANTGGGAVLDQSINDTALVTGDDYQIVFTAGPPNPTYDVINTTTGIPVVENQAYTSGDNIRFDGITVRLEDSPNPPQAGDTFDVNTTPAGTYVGDDGVIKLEIEQDTWEQVNITGDRLFLGDGIPNGVNLFQLFEDINVALRNNQQDDPDGPGPLTGLNEALEQLDQAMEQVTSIQSIVGSKQILYENTEQRLLDVKMNMDVLLSDLQDVEITDAVTDLNKQETAYQAVLSATGKIIQPSLLDFIR
ncbi:MAG: flagellin [Candidatus Sumerlaeota bacterium]